MNSTEKLHLPVDGILEMFSSFTGHRQKHLTNPHLAVQHPKVSRPSKTGMGVIETVKDCWRQQEKTIAGRRSSSCGRQQGSTQRLPKRSMDLLEMGLTKPRNCCRLVVLGGPKVGKTNILHRFLDQEFEEQYQPTSEDFYRKLFHIGGESYQVDVLDASGERDFPAKRRLSILTGDLFLLVFSLDNSDSFSQVCELLKEIKSAKAKLHTLKHPVRVPVVVCGNKSDLEAQRTVSRSAVTETLGDDVSFFETSAKDGSGLDGMFGALASLAGLPDEAGPSGHRVVPFLTYQSMCVGRRGRKGSGSPCAAVDPTARRPSFTSDLRMVLGSSARHSKPEKCQIQ